MKYTKHSNNMIRCWDTIKGGVILCTLLLLLASCDNNSVVNDAQEPDQEISQIDGKPIVKLKAADFYYGNVLDDIRNKLASDHGTAIIEALNQQASQQGMQALSSIPVLELNNLVQRKENALEIGSSHIRVEDPDGDTEDFVLSLRRYHQNPVQALQKGVTQLSASTTYLALSPDRFYLQDDENGNEQWPVTFPAVSLDDPTDEITVTFNADGFVSSSLGENPQAKTSASSDQPNLVFAEATPVVEPMDVDPCYPTCSGGGSGTARENDFTRGDDPRTPNEPLGTDRTYFVVHSIKLAKVGDGDGATDLQMFVQKSDSYSGQNMPLKYRYRYDNAYRVDPTCDCNIPSNNTKIEGADRHVYEVPDINQKGIDYYFAERWVNPFGTGWSASYVGFFPIVDLTSHPGDWRVVMSDDDKDYQDFSRRQQDEFYPEIDTYNMANGNYNLTNTGFTVETKSTGSSDDPRWGSGVRKITQVNVQSQMYSGQVVAQTIVEGNQFKYVFGLETYDPRQL